MKRRAAYPDEWLPTKEAFAMFTQFRKIEAFRYHLGQREDNGLMAYKAVRKGPLGLVVNPSRFYAWLIASDEVRDAA